MATDSQPSAKSLNRRLTMPSYGLRLAEDLVSLKVQFLQGGRARPADLERLGRVHARALANVEACLRVSSHADDGARPSRLGLGDRDVAVVAYDPDWPVRFDAEAALVRERLGPAVVAVHHTGSTSIPGMPAKPIVDFATAVAPGTLAVELPRITTAMAELGYSYFGDWGHHGGHFFGKRSGPLRTFAMQLHEADSADLAYLLRFRDAARTDPALSRDYADVKAALASVFGGSRAFYQWYKSHWLNDRLLTDHEPGAWGRFYLRAGYPTAFQIIIRVVSSRLRGGQRLHPMANRKPVAS
jgi:GrpB-like predicted nucleotidyltransferase (UPF0157 family)